MTAAPASKNPFPGLRPFTQEEDYLFFGREQQTIELLERLGSNRFVAVVGTSGSGKSSLVRCGLLSELLGGRMLEAGAAWEIAVTHPGGNPLALLADALLDADLYDRQAEHARENLLATLSRSHFGLVEAVKQAALDAGTNFLLVVDQFEEIFRFHEAGQRQQEVANEYVSLLLEAAAQKDVPIYIVLTMRSDFIGECGQFEDLAEMVNRGEFLIPRLTRDQFKRVIEGPIKVAGGHIAPRLLQRLLNDLGQQADQLPCLQHALMRTWDVWAEKGDAEALDLDDYQRVGRMSQALSLHADEVYESLASDRERDLCRGIFQALTVEESGSRGIRRPQRVGRLCQILEVDADEIRPIIDAYRQGGVTFLMPPQEVPLTEQTIIDISHESLMRVWTRLRQWVEEETQAAGIYHRLSESADLHQHGKAGLYRDPELGIALAWRETKRPNAAWAERYRPGFDAAIAFLDASQQATIAEEQSRDAARQRELKQAQELAEAQQLRLAQQQRAARKLRAMIGGLAAVAVFAGAACLVALVANQRANRLAEDALRSELTAKASESRALQSQQDTAQALALVASQKAAVDSSLTKARAAEQVALAAEEAGRKLLYTTDLKLAPFVWRDDRTTANQLRLLLAKHVPDGVAGGEKTDLRGFEWHYYQHLLEHSATVLSGRADDLAEAVLATERRVVSLDQSGQIRHWDLQSRMDDEASRRVLPGGRPAQARALSSDGRLAALAAGTKIRLFDVSTGQELRQINSANVADRWLVFTHGGQRLVIVDDKIRWCDAASGAVVASLDQQFDNIKTLALSADGLTLAVVGHGNTSGQFSVFRLDVAAKRVTPLAKDVAFGGTLHASALSPNGSVVVVGASLSGSIYVLDAATGRGMAMHRSAHASPAAAMAFSDDGRKLATADADGTIKIWDPAQFGSKSVALATLKGHQGAVATIDFSADGKRLLTTGIDKTLRVWDLDNTGAAIRPVEQSGLAAVGRFSPDGLLIAMGEPGEIGLWDASTGRIVGYLPAGDKGRVHSVAFSPTDHRLLAVGYGGEADVSFVSLWDLEARVELARLPGATDLPGFPQGENNSAVGALAFSPDGKYLVAGFGVKNLFQPAGSQFPLKVWEVATRRVVRRLAGHTGYCLSLDFTRDGALLASGSRDGTVILWSTATWKPVHTLRNPDPESLFGRLDAQAMVESVAFSPDGKTLALASREGTVQLWNVADGTLRESLRGHSGAVSAVVFAPDGRTLASGGADQTVRLWNVETQSELMQLDPGSLELGEVKTLAFSPQGTQLLAGGDRTAIWSSAPLVWDDAEQAAGLLRPLLNSNADFQNRVRILSENLQLHAALANLDADDSRVQASLAATEANWHASREDWPAAVAAFDRLRAADPAKFTDWLRTPGLLRVATALLNQDRPRDAASLLTGGAKRRIADGFFPVADRVAVGMVFATVDGSPVVDRLLPASPAARSALRKGDIVRKVNDTEITRENLNQLFAMLAGEAGSTVKVTIERPGSNDPIVIELTREQFVNDSQTGELLHPLRIALSERLAKESRHAGLLELRAELAGQWSDAKAQLADYTAAIESLTEQTEEGASDDLTRLYGRRGHAHVALEQWQAAADDFARVVSDATTDEALLAGQALATGRAAAARLPECSVKLGKTNEASGLNLAPYDADGATEPAEAGGEQCVLVKTPSRGWGHAYFAIDDSFKWASVMNARVEVEYWALGSGSLQVHYDSHHGGTYCAAPETVRLSSAQGWKTASFSLPEARFENSQNGDADFRLLATTTGRFYVKRVSVRRLIPGEQSGDPWVLLAGVHLINDDQAAIDKLIERRPASAAAIGDLFAARKQWQRAIAIYSHGISEQNADALLLAKRAAAYEALANWDAAATDWTQAAARDPDGAGLLAASARRLVAAGQPKLARQQFARSQALYEQWFQADPDSDVIAEELAQLLLEQLEIDRWTVLVPTDMKSSGGATLTPQPDGSLLASGTNPEKDSYTLKALGTAQPITAFRLETLPDASLPYGGAGRAAENGNFSLSRWMVAIEPKTPDDQAQIIRWKDAWSDHGVGAAEHYSRRAMNIGLVIDDDAKSYWDTHPKSNVPHSAIFFPDEPLEPAGAVLGFRLDFHAHTRHSLGRFRLSVSHQPVDLTWERNRLAALQLTDPRAKLAGAYAAIGQYDVALSHIKAALERNDQYDARQPILEAAARFDKVLTALLNERPDDPQLKLVMARQRAALGRELLGDKRPAEAQAQLEQARDLFTRIVSTADQWTVLSPLEMRAESGSRMQVEADGAVFVHQEQPIANDTYTLVFETDLPRITGLQLEALADPRLPAGGSGWGGNGNFQVTGITLTAAQAASPNQPRPIALRGAIADFTEPGLNVGGAIDADDTTAWGVFGRVRENHAAVFQLAEPLEGGQRARLTLTVEHRSRFQDHNLGHFRLSFTGDARGLQVDRLRLDLKGREIADCLIALGTALAEQGRNGQAVDSFAAALAHLPHRADKADLIAAAAPLAGVLEPLAIRAADDGLLQAELARHYADRRHAQLAEAARTKARALFETRLRKEPENSLAAIELAELLLPPIDATTRLSVPTSEKEVLRWRYTTAPPATDWMGEQFDDSQWSEGAGAFGKGSAVGAQLRTEWATSDIWLRRTFEWQPDPEPRTLVLRALHDDGFELFINGQEVARRPAHATAYALYALDGKALAALRPGTNTLAVHCHSTVGNQYIDVGLHGLPFDPLLAERRLAAMRLTEPWLKLAAAYTLDDRPAEATEYFAKALHDVDGYEARRPIIELAAESEHVLASLVALQPNDQQLQVALARSLTAGGKAALAAEKPAAALPLLQQAQQIHARLSEPAVHWTVLKPSEMQTDGGAKLEVQKDGSIFVHEPAGNDSYSLTFQTDLRGIKALRLETLADARLPAGGPGWNPNGSYILSELALQAAPVESPDRPRSIALKNPSADFSQTSGKGWNIRGAVDGRGDTGWAIVPQVNQDHSAVFETSEELGDGRPLRLSIRISHDQRQEKVALGRFRLSVTSDAATLPATRVRWELNDRDAADLHATLGTTFARLGRQGEAIAAFEKALSFAQDRAGKARIIAEAASLEGTLEQLAEQAASDGLFQAELTAHFATQGKDQLVEAARTKARGLLEQSLHEDPDNSTLAIQLADLLTHTSAVKWTTLRPTEMKTHKGATLKLLPDGSILAGGENQPAESYDLVMQPSLETITAFRLEVLTDESLPRMGPGRGASGNFGITWKLNAAISSEGGAPKALQIQSAVADYSYSRFPITPARWNIQGAQGQPHQAYLALAAPLTRASGHEITLTIQGPTGGQWADQNLGRFRVSATDDPRALSYETDRIAANKLTDPWARLGAAYLLAGDTERAADLLASAAERGAIDAWLDLGPTTDKILDVVQARRPEAYVMLLPPLAGAAAERGWIDQARNLYQRLAVSQPESSLWKERIDQLQPGALAVWNFDSGPGQWGSAERCELSVKGGVLTVRTTGDDPVFSSPVNVPAGTTALVLRYRTPSAFTMQVYWAAPSENFEDARHVDYDVPPASGEWSEITIPLASRAALERLRLDSSWQPDHRLEIDSVVLKRLAQPEYARLATQLWVDPELDRLTKEIEADSQSAEKFAARAYYLARCGRWTESAAGYAQELKLNPQDRIAWFKAATCLALAGDDEAYERHCRAMIANFSDSGRGDIADSVCKACLLRPSAIKLADLPIQQLRDANTDGEYEDVRPWFVACCGLASYREGNYDEAIVWTKKHPDFQGQSGALALVVRAMAEHQLGQSDQAKKTLSQAEGLIPVSLGTLGSADYAGQMPVSASEVSHDWLAPEVLRREAKNLVIGDSPRQGTGTTTIPAPR